MKSATIVTTSTTKRRMSNYELRHSFKKGGKWNPGDGNRYWKWITEIQKPKTVNPIINRGEDTTTYGDATPWLQPGTPKGDLFILTQGGHRKVVDNPFNVGGNTNQESSGIIPRIRRH